MSNCPSPPSPPSLQSNLKSSDTPTPAPPAPAPTPKICKSGAGNMGFAIGQSLLGITGFGFVMGKSPLEKLQDQIQSEQEQTQGLINEGTTIFAKDQVSFNENIIRSVNLVNSSLHNYVNYQNEIIKEKTILNQTYIFGTFILVIIIVIFLSISNALNK